MDTEELRKFFVEFQDYLAPRLDTYEQAIYLYVFRHSRFVNCEEVVLGFKSARKRMAFGLGVDRTPMSEGSAYKKLASLEAKGCIEVLQTEHKGRRLRLLLPSEIPGILPKDPDLLPVDFENLDFFEVEENRRAILEREGYKCFYTLRTIDENSFVAEHVVSRPHGDNSYRNIVAASREANNMKGGMSAEDFIRKLFRDGFLSESEMIDRFEALADLKAGKLKPLGIISS